MTYMIYMRRNTLALFCVYSIWELLNTNTKEGLLWYLDHAMGIARINVYAGLVGFYEIIGTEISI